jgi:hypothetical protein
MESMLWILLPGISAVASAILAWFVMQSRMEVKLADQRAQLAQERGSLEADRANLETSLATAVRAAEESAKRQSFENFLNDITIEQRHYTRENKLLLHNRKTLVLQERIFFRNIPLSDWIEHEIVVSDDADMNKLVQDMTVFDRQVVSIAEIQRGPGTELQRAAPQRQLA